jgi:hypothetical protein
VAKLVRVSRDESAVILESNGWYSVVSSDNTVQGTSDSLTSLTASGSWRKPVSNDTQKFSSAPMALNTDNPLNRVVRTPKAVREALHSAAKADKNRKNTPFLLKMATQKSVTVADAYKLLGIIEEAEKSTDIYGGETTKSWAEKISNPEPLTAAGAFEPSDELFYVATSDKENSTEMNALFAVTEEDLLLAWTGKEFTPVPMNVDELEVPTIAEIDPDTAKALADWIEGGGTGYLDIATVDMDEFSLFQSAFSEMDFEEIDRANAIIADATGYGTVERSHDAMAQQRTSTGKFVGDKDAKGTSVTQPTEVPEAAPVAPEQSVEGRTKATLSVDLPVVSDVESFIAEYVEIAKKRAMTAAAVSEDSEAATTEDVPTEEEIAETAKPGTTKPLYMAIVDPVDRTAVLDFVAIMPDSSGEPTSWKRVGGTWVEDPSVLADMRGVTPPTVEEIKDEAVIKDTLAQIDAFDAEGGVNAESLTASANEFTDYKKNTREKYAKQGIALPDGSYPIKNVADLKNAIQAFGRAKESDRAKVRRHIRKRARALNRTDLIPDSWKETAVSDSVQYLDDESPLYDPFGVLIAAGVPGTADTPSDLAAVRRLKEYWKRGAGAAKIRWGTEGDLTRCARNVGKYMPGRQWGYCQNLHKEIFGQSNAERDN